MLSTSSSTIPLEFSANSFIPCANDLRPSPKSFNDSEIDEAMNEILKYDLLGNYVKVNKETAQKFADYAKKMMYSSEESS